MWSETERQEMLKKAEKIQVIRDAAKKEKDVKIIEATNLMSDWVKKIQEFLTLNESRLIGKKIFLTDGSRSKLFSEVMDEIITTFNLGMWENCYITKSGGYSELRMSISVFGGKDSHENDGVNTKYNVKVDRTVYNFINYDSDFKYVSFDKSVMLKKYSYDAYIQAEKEVDEINKQIKELENKRRDVKNDIPSALMTC